MKRSPQLKICKASAGSGKTYTLVLEYLSLALSDQEGKSYKKILAVTFTNMAANEMKERIVLELEQLSSGKFGNTNYLNSLQKELKLTPRKIQERAQKTLSGILHDYSDFSVMTIDKFVHKITRSFSRELNISSDFDIEMDAEEVKERISANLLEKAGDDQEITQLLKQALLLRIDQNKNWDIKKDLTRYTGLLMNEDISQKIEEIPEYKVDQLIKYRDDLKKSLATFEKAVQKRVDELDSMVKLAGVSFDDFTQHLDKFLISLRDDPFLEDHLKKTDTAYWKKAVNDGKFFTQKKLNEIEEEVKPHIDSWQKKFQEIDDLFNGDAGRKYTDELSLYRNIFLTGVLSRLKRVADEIKNQENFLMISDFYKLITELILKEQVAFIFEKMGNRYDHFLIDEFQDTSVLQWLNFIPLIENSLAQGHRNFIVGDIKQSIYRFRNGEVEQFKSLPELYNPNGNEFIREKEISFINNEDTLVLDTNRRSSPIIVDFNNRFFKTLVEENKEFIPLAPYYENLEQKKFKKSPEGFVRWYDLYSDGLKGDKNVEMELLIHEIEMKLQQGYSYKDISILTRANHDGVRIANELIQAGIPVISRESLEIKSHPSTRCVVYYLELLLFPKKRTILSLFLDNYFRVSSEKNSTLDWNTMVFNKDRDQETKVTEVLEQLNLISNIEEFKSTSLYLLVERIILELNLELKDNVYLQFLLHIADDFMNTQSANPDLFISWFWEKGGSKSVKIPDGIDAINVTSIHKSKGLQFKVVMVPQTDFSGTSSPLTDIKLTENEQVTQALLDIKERGSYGDEYEEEKLKMKLDILNIYYVAFTRAEHQLIVFNKHKEVHKTIQQLNGKEEQIREINTFNWGSNGKVVLEKDEPEVKKKEVEIRPFRNEEIPEFAHFSPVDQDEEGWKTKMEKGKHIHEILSSIENIESWESDTEVWLHKHQLDKHQWMDEIRSFINDKQLAAFYDQELQMVTEKGLITAEGQRKVPDRVVFEKDRIKVLEFKTGMPSNKHHKQVKEYADLLSAIENKKVEGYIYYTGLKKLEAVL